MTIRVLLADDHDIFRIGLKSVLALHPDLHIAGEATDGEQAVRLARQLNPDIILMDIGMPNLNGIEATRQIRNAGDAKVIALSVHSEAIIVRRMLEAGATGYLTKDCAADEVERAIKAVLSGQVYLGTGLSDVVVRQFGSSIVASSPLSRREEDVLRQIANGLTTKEIARLLGVSPKTVDTHRQHLMGKLDIHSIAELTKYALRLGLSSIERAPHSKEPSPDSTS